MWGTSITADTVFNEGVQPNSNQTSLNSSCRNSCADNAYPTISGKEFVLCWMIFKVL